MPYPTIIVLLLKIILSISLDKIPQSNQLIEEAAYHFQQKDYARALIKYEALNNDLGIKDINMRLNLAHCYFYTGDTANAKKRYFPYRKSANALVRTVACQQLGVMAFGNQAYTEALNYFRLALNADPGNEEARYNFELVKKLLAVNDGLLAKNETLPLPEAGKQPEKNEPSPDMAPQASETNTGTKTPVKPEENQELTQQEQIQERLKEINISADKAQMILDAMKQTEIQYIQQHKKTGTKKQSKDLPDW